MALREMAQAIAVSKCYLAAVAPPDMFRRRTHDGKVDPKGEPTFIAQAHPAPCKFCKLTIERKVDALYEFYEWAGFGKPVDPDFGGLQPAIEQFLSLPEAEQARLAYEAAGYKKEQYEHILADKETISAGLAEAVRGPVAERPRSGDAGGRGQRSTPPPAGTSPGGLSNRTQAAPGSLSGRFPVPASERTSADSAGRAAIHDADELAGE